MELWDSAVFVRPYGAGEFWGIPFPGRSPLTHPIERKSLAGDPE